MTGLIAKYFCPSQSKQSLMHLFYSFLLSCTFLIHLGGAESTVAPLSEIEKAQFEKVATSDYELVKGVSFSGSRLHEILNHEDQFSPEIIAAVIVAHECKNLEVKSPLNCWNKDYIDRIVRCMKYFNKYNTCHIVDSLIAYAAYKSTSEVALEMLNNFDYAKFTDLGLKANYYRLSGLAKLKAKSPLVDDSIHDFHIGKVTFLEIPDLNGALACQINYIRAKMENSVYEKYKNSIDADFAEAYDLLVRSGAHDESESGVYHAHGIYLCNQGMEKFDVKLMIQAQDKLKQAVDIKVKSKLYIQSQAVSLKIYGDISLRLAVRFKCNVQDNAALAFESYKTAIHLNSSINYESCLNLLDGIYASLKILKRSGEFRSLLVEWRESEDTSANMKAAIDFNFSTMNAGSERVKPKEELVEASP